jgi:hypothetical protein
MKNFLRLGSIALLVFFALSCSTDDNDALKNGKSSTTFRFAPEDVPDLNLPQGTQLKVNIETPDGEPVASDVTLAFNESEGSYLSEKLMLSPGEYVITSFELVNDNKLLYLTPDKSILGAKTFRYVLPIDFKVRPETREEVNLKVVSASVAGLTNSLSVAVYVPRSGIMKLATATAYIIDGVDTLATHELIARTNRIPFPFDPATEYKLVIIKGGFTRESRNFIYNDVWDSVLRFDLDPAFTMLGYTHVNYSTIFQFSMDSHPGTVNIDWGDGTYGSHTFTAAQDWYNFEHDYAADGNHFITITGDLNQVYFFYSFYGQGMLDAINFEQLVNLNEIRLGLTRGPAKINVSQNLNLQSIRMPGVQGLRDLVLPSNHTIHYLDISGRNDMNMSEVSGLINNMYNNAVAHGLTGGYINVAGSWWSDPTEPLFVGPPSTDAKSKLVILREDYGWSVDPEF